jgi:hypothetical protein
MIGLPSPILSDIDCDGQLDVIQGSLFECLVGWQAEGKRLGGFPLTLGGGCSSVALGDMDGDGARELIAGAGDGRADLYLGGEFLGSIEYGEGFVYAYSHPGGGAEDCRSPWQAAFFDATRNAVYPAHLMPQQPEPGDELLVEGSFHAFPNPAGDRDPLTGRRTISFVFETETGGIATIEMFDVTGAKVRTIEYDATSQVSKVTVPLIDISDLGSGLYVCWLSLEGDRENATESFKLAVRR